MFQGKVAARGEVYGEVSDFSRVSSVSSHGLRVLIRTSRELSNKGGKLVLHSLDPGVRRSFETTGFSMILRISDSLDDALAGVGNTGLLPACPIRPPAAK